jgi:signal transduction histidine kinase/DNA-binding response OmpR family regulator/streptogramin lyase/HPt (histidine-containing phosphotransfer) domain-containing protein
LRRFDTRSQICTHEWPSPGHSNAMLTDASGLLWVGTRTGLALFDPGNGSYRALVHDPGDPYSLRANEVTSLRHDREGNRWVGTKGGGVSRFSESILRFGAWRKGPGGVGTFNESNMRAIYADRSGVVWLGTYGGGLNRFDPGSGNFQHYLYDQRHPNSGDYNRIFSIHQDRQGELWTANEKDLGRFDPKSGSFQHFKLDRPNSRLYSILEDTRGRFWLGTDLTFDRRTGKFTQAGDPKKEKGNLNIYEDRQGNVWFTAGDGLRKLDTSGKSREILLSRGIDASGPSRVQVNFIHEGSGSTLWLATETGLVELDSKTERYTDYTTKEGLPDNIVQCILPDDAGNLWISTSKGISRFNPGNKSFFNYAESDGLQGQFFNRKSCFRDESGWMYFGGLKGFNRFHPAQILSRPLPPPPVLITKFDIHGNTVPIADRSLPRPIWDMTGLKLAHDQNGLSFEFAALSYANREKIRYRFKMDSAEEHWTKLDAQQRNARYSGLRPGQYVFRVQASTDGGVSWGEQGASLALDITPPWWNTPWTKSAAALAFIGLIVGTYKLRVRTLHKRQLQLEGLVQQRTAQLVEANQRAEEATAMKSIFLANMSHEIRTPMNAVIGMAYLALKTTLTDKQRDYINKIHNAGTLLLGVINDILDFSKIEAGRLDIEAVEFHLDDVIASVTSITAQKAQEKGLELLVEITSLVPPDLVGDPLRLGQIITNLINNAVKFTEKGEIHVKAELLEQTGGRAHLQFSVKDTGIGMTPEQAARLFQPFSQADMSTTRKHGGTGLGLTICKRLVELMAGEIRLTSEPGIGSTFQFTIWAGVASEAPRKRIAPEQLRQISALVVDDSAVAREILVNALNCLCAHVDAAGSGEEAIAAVKRSDPVRPYDVIFMDWRMPGMDGLQATRIVKEDSGLTRPPAVVLVTAFGHDDVRENAGHKLIDGYLLKPVTASMLMDTLVNLFAGDLEERETKPAVDGHLNCLRGVRILLAEDNEINQQIAVELLEGAGASVTVANDGLEAVNKLADQPFDIVLMDVQMPRMDGYEATRKLRTEPRFAELPIIAMTAHATIEERQKCIDAGMNGHVSKPIDPAALFDTVMRFAEPRIGEPVESSGMAFASSEESLPQVTGLDAAGGLARMAGNKKLYWKLLSQFAANEADAAERIGAALNGKDRLLAERLAHTVKGVAGNLGATVVEEAAANLERAIAHSSPALDTELLRVSLDKRITQLIGELNPSLPYSDGERPLTTDTAQLNLVIERMSGYLAESDATAVDYLESVAPQLRSIFEEGKYDSFAALVDSYSFSEALGQLTAARAKGINGTQVNQ